MATVRSVTGGAVVRVRKGKPGSKPEREQLRRELLAEGCDPRQIMEEMVRRWNFRPRQAWRHAHGMTQDEAAERCNSLTKEGDSLLTGKRISEYEIWPLGGSRPGVRALFRLGRVYKVGPIELTDLLDRKNYPVEELELLRAGGASAALRPVGSAGPVRNPVAVPRRGFEPRVRSREIKEVAVMAAAHESSDHAARAETSNIGASGLDTLRDDVIRLSRELVHQDPLPLFGQMVATRDRIYGVLEGHQRPRQSAELYFLAAVVCGLLADVSHTFGYYSAALEQTRAAWAYAEIVGHDSLRVWCRAAQSWYAYRDQRPQAAAALARSGQRFAGRNEASKQRLYSMEGAALASMGDVDGALRAFRLAEEARERQSGTDDFFDEVGGIFTADRARQYHNAATGIISLGRGEDAASAARSAIRLYEQGPDSSRDTSLEAGARITLATSCLLRRDVDAAREELRPVLDLPVHMRSDHMRALLLDFAKSLALPAVRDSSLAGELRSAVEEFHIPMLPGGLH